MASEPRPNSIWLSLVLCKLLSALFARMRCRDRGHSPDLADKGVPRVEILAQYHAAEYASERNSVDVWKTLQYALIPIIFVVWSLLLQVQASLNPIFFCWAFAAVLPVCYVAYQKAMVDALTGVLLIEKLVRRSAIELAGTDKFWFHEPVYRKGVKSDLAYGWFWPPLLSFASAFAGLAYRVITAQPFSGPDWWRQLDGYGDLVGYSSCCVVAWFVGSLSEQGLDLNKRIDLQIQEHKLSWLRNGQADDLLAQPVERTTDATAHL